MKKKAILMGVAGVLAMAAIVGGTLAGFNTETKEAGVTNISTKALSIDVIGKGQNDGITENFTEIAKVAPGGTFPSSYSVKNDMPDGYELYTRVTIYKSWKNAETTLDSKYITLYSGNEQEKVELTTKEGKPAKLDNGWIVWYADAQQVILFYTKPLQSGEQTGDFLSFVGTDVNMNNEYAGAKIDLDIQVDAVQTAAAEDAMMAEWGVYPIIDAEKNITSIEE